jgi:16S rRNA (guanine966-N2)-methyltransferase
MRIIGGRFRSRLILGPEEDGTTRPITDRVKQSLFDIVTPLLDGGAIVYDCFAGTGSMGLESLSRGAKHAFFFESDRSALARLKKNIQSLNVEASSTIVASDLFKYFAAAHPPTEPVKLIFLDPPYRFVSERPEQLRALAQRLAQHRDSDGLLVFRHEAGVRLDLPPFSAIDTRSYGGMTIDFLRCVSR